MDLIKKVLYPINDFQLTLEIFYFQDYDHEDLQQFKRSLLNGCDYNRDKKISKAELKMVLLALAQPADS